MTTRIVVDRGLCDGNGLCAREAPRHFVLDENDELHLLQDEVASGERDAVERAIRSCPKAALRMVES
jgi:ferredoxin